MGRKNRWRVGGASVCWPAGAFGGLAVVTMAWHAPRAHDMVAAAEFALVVLSIGVAALTVVILAGARPVLSGGGSLFGAICALAVMASLTQSELPLVASVRMALYVGLLALGLAVYLYYRYESSVSLRAWCWMLGAIHVPFVLHAVIDMGTWQGAFEPEVGVFANIRHFGTAGFIAASAASVVLIRGRRVSKLACLLLTVALFGVVASGSRGALMAWLVVIAALAVALQGSCAWRRFLAAAGVAAGTAGGGVLVLHAVGALLTPNLFVRADAAASGEVKDLSSGRIDLWGEALRQFATSPWFGKGPDAFRISECCAVLHPHNVVLQLLLEFGAIGAMLLGVWVMLARRALRPRGALVTIVARTEESRALTALLLGFVALSLVAGASYWGYPLLHLPILLGLWAATITRADPSWGHGHSNPSENAASRSWVE